MPARTSQRSRTYATILVNGGSLDVFFYWRTTTKEAGKSDLKALSWKYSRTPWSPNDRSYLIDLLVKAGLHVRHYDEEHKQWMEESLNEGSSPAKGNRDGSWALPSLEEFETEYLAA